MYTNANTIQVTSCHQTLINTRTCKRHPRERNVDYICPEFDFTIVAFNWGELTQAEY